MATWCSHALTQDDEVFTFNFNLIVTRGGKQATYALNKTCTLSLPWSPREVTCEVNYMEVSLDSTCSCFFFFFNPGNSLSSLIILDFLQVSVRSEATCPYVENGDSAFKPVCFILSATAKPNVYAQLKLQIWVGFS